jgi:cytoskeletal protein CcmA (bactofilin family)
MQAPSPISIISRGLVISGEVTGGEDVEIDGQLRGSVRLAGARMLITPDGNVSGNIEAREVVVRGKLKGNVVAGERILVGATGVWEGDSVSPRLVIEDGAVVNGKLEILRPKRATVVPQGVTTPQPQPLPKALPESPQRVAPVVGASTTGTTAESLVEQVAPIRG